MSKRMQNKRQYGMARQRKEKAPFPRPSHLLALILLVIVGFGFYRFASYLITDSQMFLLKNIRVTGTQYVGKSQVMKAAGVQPGVRLFQVPLDSVAARILENPYLRGASVSRSLPSTLILSVQEREPAAYLIDHKVYMVDPGGIVLLKKPGMSVNNLPMITGLSVRKILQNRQPVYDALDLIDKIKMVDSDLFNFISEIHIEAHRPPMLYLVRGGATVEIGRERIFQRLYVLSEFIKKTEILNQLEDIRKIDITYSNRIVVTRKS